MGGFGSGNVPKSCQTSEDFYDENTVRKLSVEKLLLDFSPEVPTGRHGGNGKGRTFEGPAVRKVCGENTVSLYISCCFCFFHDLLPEPKLFWLSSWFRNRGIFVEMIF